MSTESDDATKNQYVSTAYVFSSAVSYIPTHNYLNKAYHDANLHFLCPPSEWHWRIPAASVPLQVRRILEVSDIVGTLKASVRKARDIVEEGRSYLDTEVTRRIHYSPDGPHPRMHSSVKVERHEKEGYASGWDYTFNAYELALALLDDYEKFIDKMVASRLSPFTKIARISRMARSIDPSVSLVNTEMTFNDMRQPWPSS